MQHFSSRRESLERSFLATRLEGEKAYDHVAGYCSSALLEVAEKR